MQELLDPRHVVEPGTTLPADPSLPGADERPARVELRRQIGRLEHELGSLFASAFPQGAVDWSAPASGGPRLLSLGELESVRDVLAGRVADVRSILDGRYTIEARNRELIERMVAAPERYKWVRVSNVDIGEPGCRHWHSRPKLGLIGMLMGWWRVKVSSGCPLAGGRRARARGPAPSIDSPQLALATAKERRKRRQARRSAPSERPQPAAPAPRPPRARARAADERPPAPWGSFPLVELTVLVALVLLGIGFFGGNPIALGVGLILGSAAGLELSIREHFAGFRSHTLLLAATAFVAVVAAILYLADAPVVVALAAGAVVFAALFFALRAAFRKASGGLTFRAGLRG